MQKRYKKICELSSIEAKEFFLKNEGYCNIDLPPYINFKNMLNDIYNILEKNSDYIDSNAKGKDKYYNNVNHIIFNNKDGKYSWRPFELIHPVLYVGMIIKLTQDKHWKLICDRFKEFQNNRKIKCISYPVVSLTNKKDKAVQIGIWRDEIEQESLKLSLDYKYIIHSDITDCYGSIYTHSIAWAIHGKDKAKDERHNDKLIGNIIDKSIQEMRHGQTNGIPQGSVLMDFIAEMVLGYADSELTKKIKTIKISKYYILRYRDDYRIFVNSAVDADKILKCLTEVLIDLGLKLNGNKTKVSDSIIEDSLKPDKLAWINKKNSEKNLQKHLLIIYSHAMKFSNSGSLFRSLIDFYIRIKDKKNIADIEPMISIVVEIAYRNPRTYPVVSAILSKLIYFIPSPKKKSIINRIKKKFSQIPNTGYMDIWLQRIIIKYPVLQNIMFEEPLCQIIGNSISSSSKDVQIWSNNFIKSTHPVINAMDANKIFCKKIMEEIDPIVSMKEINPFPQFS
ncbi:MAG: RNA-directed DNA polymerase [bacterium]